MSESPGFSRDGQRYLDGGPHGMLEPAERAAADQLLEAAARYRESLPALGSPVDARVMAAVRQHTVRPAAVPAVWSWLIEPRIRPVWVPLAAAAAALAVWIGTRGAEPVVPPLAPAAAARGVPSDTVYVRFELVAPGAHSVAVAGSFNGWSAEALPMFRAAGGAWTVTVPLPIGEHRYQFVLDGRLWQPDSTAHALVNDGFGGTNSVIVVGPKGLVRT